MKNNKYIFYVLLMLMLLHLPVIAKKQIIWQNVSARYLDCKLIDSLNYVIVGDDGKIISSSDGGETWSWLECGLRNIFYSVDFLNLERGAVVGSDGAFALTSDAGKTWKTGIIDTTTLFAVKILDDNTIFASGKNTCLYKTTDFGDTWNIVFNGDSLTLENWYFFRDSIKTVESNYSNSDFYFLNNDTGFACGVGPNILKTTDGGNSWRLVFQESDSTILSNIDFYNNEIGIAVGGKLGWYKEMNYLGLKSFSVLTTNGGETWKELLTSGIGQSYGVKFYDENYIYILGSSGYFSITKNFGTSWSSYRYIDYKYYRDNTDFYDDTTTALGSSYFLKSPSFDDYGNILSISNHGSIFKSNNYGYNYSTLKSCEMYDPSAKSFQTIYKCIPISKNRLVFPGIYSKVFGSSDSGTTWDKFFPRYEINSDSAKSFWFKITQYDAKLITGYFQDSLAGFIAGTKPASMNGRKYTHTINTNDGGISWEFKDNLDLSIPIAYIGSSTMYCINNERFNNSVLRYYILESKDNGMLWDTINIIQPPFDSKERDSFKPSQLIFPDSLNGFLSLFYGQVFTDDSLKYPKGYKSVFKILKTKDFCRTFDTISVLEYDKITDYKMSFVNKDICFLTKTGNIVLKTTDGFKSYEEFLLPGTYHFINDIYFLDEYYGIAVGKQDTIFTTEDGGNSWKIEVFPFNRKFSGNSEWVYDFNGISKSKNGDLFLTGKGRIVRGIVIDSTDISVKEETEGTFCPFYYVSVLPNPVSDIAKIKIIGLHYAQGKRLYLRIYDINGNFRKDLSEVANRNNDGQSADFEADLHDLPNGIYFIELEANNLIRAQKFIKE